MMHYSQCFLCDVIIIVYLCTMKLNVFLIRELHQDRHLTSEVDKLFVEREVKKGDLLVREGSHIDRVLFFEQGIA